MFNIMIVSFIAFFFSSSIFSCTTIFWNNNPKAKVVARSVDLFVSDTPIIKTQPRGLMHNGDSGENSLSWKSKYGSVIVTAFHANAVTDGINEKGLAAHLLYLSGTEYPANKNNKPEISNLMWSQYILDNFTTVNEALEGSKDLQIVFKKVNGQTWPIHLTIEDSSGDSAIVEFIKGKMHVYHGSQYRVMTNEPAYNIQLSNLKNYQSFGGKKPLPGDPDPLSRFVRASAFLKTLPTPETDLESIAGVLAVMRTAMVPFGALDTSGNKTEDAWATRWVSVADVTNKIYYFNSTSAPNIIWVDLNKVDFTEGSPILSIDPTDIKLKGDITKELVS